MPERRKTIRKDAHSAAGPTPEDGCQAAISHLGAPSIVALVGFSGSGKSYLASTFEGADIVDTDRWVGARLGRSLRQLYFDLPAGADRQPVLDMIAAAEECFLREWSPAAGSKTVIAVGPGIPPCARSWKAFLDRTSAVAIYLKAKPSLIESRLISRFEAERADYDGKPNAQAWNCGILTKKVGEDYVPLSRSEMQANIAQYIAMNDEHYARFAIETFDCLELNDPEGSTIKRFREFVRTKLGLEQNGDDKHGSGGVFGGR